MSANLDQVKKTVGDLLRLAENDAATEGEINNAITFARRMMDAHHLSEEECRTHGVKREEVMTTDKMYTSARTIAVWERTLARFVMMFIGSVGCYVNTQEPDTAIGGRLRFDDDGQPITRSCVVWYGLEGDVEIAREIYATLSCTILAMARVQYRSVYKGHGRSYAEGFVRGLTEKLELAKLTDQRASVESNALVVRSAALALAAHRRAQTWLTETRGVRLHRRTVKSGGRHFHDPYSQGKEDGKATNVGAVRKPRLAAEQLRIGRSQ